MIFITNKHKGQKLMKKAYIIGEITIINPDQYKEYVSKVTDVVAKYGGKYLVRGGNQTVMEGSPHGNRNVVIEFINFEEAKKWYYSKDYQNILNLRIDNSKGSLVLVEGY